MQRLWSRSLCYFLLCTNNDIKVILGLWTNNDIKVLLDNVRLKGNNHFTCPRSQCTLLQWVLQGMFNVVFWECLGSFWICYFDCLAIVIGCENRHFCQDTNFLQASVCKRRRTGSCTSSSPSSSPSSAPVPSSSSSTWSSFQGGQNDTRTAWRQLLYYFIFSYSEGEGRGGSTRTIPLIKVEEDGHDNGVLHLAMIVVMMMARMIPTVVIVMTPMTMTIW